MNRTVGAMFVLAATSVVAVHTGCSISKKVDHANLMREVDAKEQMLSKWTYLGSDEQYHYLRKQYLVVMPPPFHPARKNFKIDRSELEVGDEFPYELDPNGFVKKQRRIFEHDSDE